MALSSEAEYIPLAATVQEALYLIQSLDKIVNICCSVQIYEDNQGTIALGKRHISILSTRNVI